MKLSFLLCLAFWSLDLWGVQCLRHAGLFQRFQRIGPEEFRTLYREKVSTPENKAFFLRAMEGSGLDRYPKEEERVRFILRWVMNQVKKTGMDYSATAREAYQKAVSGKGLSCESMSRIFVGALRAQGFRARKVQLVRSVFNDRDTHVTTEVLLAGKWVVFDPTFNVSFRKEGALVGAEDIRQSLLDGTSGKIHPVFYGEVAYPERLENYYMFWLPPYNNVMIFEKKIDAVWTKLPLLRFWFGPRFYYLESSPEGLWHFHSINRDYFTYVVVLPALGFLMGAIGAACFFYPPYRRRGNLP